MTPERVIQLVGPCTHNKPVKHGRFHCHTCRTMAYRKNPNVRARDRDNRRRLREAKRTTPPGRSPDTLILGGKMEITRDNALWFAGLFEGEGCLSTSKNRGWVISLRMTDHDIMVKIQTLFGGPLYFDQRSAKHPNLKDCWSWQLSKQAHIYAIVAAIYPFMGTRRQSKMRQFLDYFYLPVVSQSERAAAMWKDPVQRERLTQARREQWNDAEFCKRWYEARYGSSTG